MPQIWKVAPGEHANQWPMCRKRQCIVLGWRALRDYRRFGNDKRSIERALGGGYGNGSGAARSILRFAYTIRPSDIVVANQGRSRVVGIGLIKSDYLSPTSPKNPSRSHEFPHARRVDWVIDKPIDLGKRFFAPSTVTLIKPSQVSFIRQAYIRTHPELKQSLDDLFNSVLIDEQGSIETDSVLESTEQQFERQGTFDPRNVRDARIRTLSSIVRRQGQPAFRKRLLAAYARKCAITGCNLEEILEAAHITPYKGRKTNHTGNGILLRADLHTLFDFHLIAIDELTMRVLISPKLRKTDYQKYHGKKIRIPLSPHSRPSPEALGRHRGLYESGI